MDQIRWNDELSFWRLEDSVAGHRDSDRYLDAWFQRVSKKQVKESPVSGQIMTTILVEADADVVNRGPRLIVAFYQFAQEVSFRLGLCKADKADRQKETNEPHYRLP